MRIELTKKTDLAFRALTTIDATDGARVAGSTIAGELEISTQYLPHIMGPLTRAEWVTSVSGPNGGYELAVDLDRATLLDLVVVVEGPLDERCLTHGLGHNVDHCALHVPWTRARDALIHELASTPLSSVVDAGLVIA